MLLGKLPVHGIFSLCSVIHTYAQKININLKNSCGEVAFAIKSYSIFKQTQEGSYLPFLP
jgi:hypothetical protein